MSCICSHLCPSDWVFCFSVAAVLPPLPLVLAVPCFVLVGDSLPPCPSACAADAMWFPIGDTLCTELVPRISGDVVCCLVWRLCTMWTEKAIQEGEQQYLGSPSSVLLLQGELCMAFHLMRLNSPSVHSLTVSGCTALLCGAGFLAQFCCVAVPSGIDGPVLPGMDVGYNLGCFHPSLVASAAREWCAWNPLSGNALSV